MIDNNTFNRVTIIRDLGILFDQNMSFSSHIDVTVFKAFSMLGFMIRICPKFYDPLFLKNVYYSHVRSHLEYGFVVWYSVKVVQIQKTESVQTKFLIYLSQKYGLSL